MEIARQGDQCTFYVDVSGRATVICPSCHKQKVIDAMPYKGVSKPLRVNCGCGQVFTSLFEYRTNYIKNVALLGTVEDPTSKEQARVGINKLSIDGAVFTLIERLPVAHGQVLALRFTLDNAQQTPVERNVRVTSVKGSEVGAMFIGGVRNKTVGFYLMP